MTSKKPLASPAEIDLPEGRVRGRVAHDHRAFIGLPYAAPPVGALRFAEAAPVMAWSGVRDATAPGASAPQLSMSYPRIDIIPLAGDGWTPGDDYLTLNVWTPIAGRDRPVMVYIHGGGGIVGKKDALVTDGTGFARSGVVCVAINYRLGIEGFLPITGAPTNLALRDMMAALAWVKQNIRLFGGDPENVTVFGESGGGLNTAALVASPLARGLFKRAIVQSGHGSSVYRLDIARRTVDKVADLLDIPATVEAFRGVSAEALVAVQAKVARPGGLDLRDETGLDAGFGVARFSAVYGDDVLPLHPLDALAEGQGREVELLIGTTAEEGNFWFIPTSLQWLLPSFAARWLLSHVIASAPQILKDYGLGQRGQGGGGAALNRALTDLAFRWPARQFAEAHQGRTHMFEFDWRSPACGGKLGACHGVDLPFVFDTLEHASGPRGIAGINPPQALARKVQDLWVQFASDGSLPWGAFTADARWVYQLHAGSAVHEAAMPAERFLTR